MQLKGWLPTLGAGLLLSGGAAMATSAAEQNEIHGCVGPSGHVRIADDGACLTPETALNWNQQGPGGPQGERGPVGPVGPPGPPGSAEGAPAGNTSLEQHDDRALFSTPLTPEDLEAPGSRVTVNVPEGGLVAINATADARLETTCHGIGFVSVVDVDRPGEYLVDAVMTTKTTWASDDAEPAPAPALLDGLRAQRKGGLAIDPVPLPGEEPPEFFWPEISFVNVAMSPYLALSPGEHTFAFVHDVYAAEEEEPCEDLTLHSRDRQLWVSVMRPQAP